MFINKHYIISGLALPFLLLGCASHAPQSQLQRKTESYVDVVREISQPKYEGRGIGTQGLSLARDFLKLQFEDLGLKAGIHTAEGHGQAARASFLQPFAVFVGNELSGRNTLSGAKPSEFIPYSFSANGSLKFKSVVFAGFGISVRGTDKSNYDDYAGMDVKGKLVVLLLGDPGRGSTNSFFRDPSNYHYSTPMYKVQNAELHGAAAVLLVRDPLSLGEEREPSLHFQSMQGAGAKMDILAGQITVSRAQSLLRKNLMNLQKEIQFKQQPKSFEIDTSIQMNISLRRNVGKAENIAGWLPGHDSDFEKEFVVIGAHYDHLGFGGDNSLHTHGQSIVHPGADDNASGVQMVISLARRLAQEKNNRRPVLFLLFSGEESGLLGSKFYVDQMQLPTPGGKIVAMINLDMVGRMRDRNLTVLADRSGDSFSALLNPMAKANNIVLKNGGFGSRSSDHASFLMGKIPALFFNTGGHEDYHRPTDVFEKIQADGIQIITKFVYDVYQGIDRNSQAPQFVDDPKEDVSLPSAGRGYGSYFGSIPEFTEGERPGVLLQGVKEGSPAQALGLQKGDLLIEMGEINVKNLHDFVFALRYYRPGEAIEVRWVRDGKEMKGRAKLKNRD